MLCHKDFLVKQWVERLGQFLPGAQVGVVQGKRCCDMGEVDVAVVMLQTVLARRWGGADSPFAEEVGLVVADEAHHMRQGFAAALRAFPARLRLALTATPDRKDGLGYALHYFFGPTACRVRRVVTVIRVEGTDDSEVPRNYKGEVDFSRPSPASPPTRAATPGSSGSSPRPWPRPAGHPLQRPAEPPPPSGTPARPPG